MGESRQKRIERGGAVDFFTRWLGKRYGFGPEADRDIARDFEVEPRTVRDWRAGLGLPRFTQILTLIGLEPFEMILDALGADDDL